MNDLKERYIYAVAKNLPRASRKDIEKELSTLIDDMLEARCGENAPTEKDLRVVLTEIGTPAEVFSKYSPDAGKALITEDYYPQYKRWMTIILCAVVGSVAFSHLLSGLLGEMAPLAALTEGIAKCFTGALSAFGAVTILFIILQKKGKKLGHPADTIENLPPVPGKKDEISRGDSIVGIVLTALLVVLLLCFPQHIIIGFDGEGAAAGCYSVFHVQNLLEGKIWLLLFGAAGIVRHVLRGEVYKTTAHRLCGVRWVEHSVCLSVPAAPGSGQPHVPYGAGGGICGGGDVPCAVCHAVRGGFDAVVHSHSGYADRSCNGCCPNFA